MKTAVVVSTMGALAAISGVAQAQAQEVGRVLSATPVIQQVQVPRQVCTVQPVQQVQQQPSGGGALVGAIVGGLLGNQIGHGGGRAAATAVGLVGGAAIGNNIEQNNQNGQYVQGQQCTTQVTYENRTVSYNVTYEYAGKQYTVQMPYDPGPTIRLQVSPISSNNIGPSSVVTSEAGVTYGPQAVMVSPAVVSTATVGYPVYYRPAYYSPAYYNPYPVNLSIGLGYYGGGYGHRHWR
ncbi:glycine zipper 2TM domain-containing protein [Caenimonas koreensis]|uniref:glycine zipper 2TM domain-containing protein n=1 Tax=Caenimonas koreensis TaxID=367474 RepID=UPI0037831CC4